VSPQCVLVRRQSREVAEGTGGRRSGGYALHPPCCLEIGLVLVSKRRLVLALHAREAPTSPTQIGARWQANSRCAGSRPSLLRSAGWARAACPIALVESQCGKRLAVCCRQMVAREVRVGLVIHGRVHNISSVSRCCAPVALLDLRPAQLTRETCWCSPRRRAAGPGYSLVLDRIPVLRRLLLRRNDLLSDHPPVAGCTLRLNEVGGLG
jgi:hypothetical protein